MFLTKGVKLHVHLRNLVVRFVFSSVLHIWYVEVRISQSVSEGPFDFEITRVDCTTRPSCSNIISLAKSSVEKSLSLTVLPKSIVVIQSTLVISKSKGSSKTLRVIRTSTYQICSIEEKTIWTAKFYKWLCNLIILVRNIYWKYYGKGENFAPYEQFLLFSTIFCDLILNFCVKTRTRFFSSR